MWKFWWIFADVRTSANRNAHNYKTIDPTLAAQFIITAIPSRLPTFTEPPALQIATYPATVGGTTTAGIPIGYVIVILAGLGLFMTLLAVLRRG